MIRTRQDVLDEIEEAHSQNRQINLKRWNLRKADLSWTDLSAANLSGADLSGADLSGANLSQTDLNWANLSGADLSGAYLSEANLTWANLEKCNLTRSTLKASIFDYANLDCALLKDVNAKSTKFIGSSLVGVQVQGGYFDDVDFNSSTVYEDQFPKIKQTLQHLQATESKQLSFDHCQTLQDVCFAASVRQKSGYWQAKNTTTTGEELVRLLNLPENDLLRREICPNGAEVRMRHIRSHALRGMKIEYDYSLNDQDKHNEKEQPMLIFKDHLKKDSDSNRSNSVSFDHQR